MMAHKFISKHISLCESKCEKKKRNTFLGMCSIFSRLKGILCGEYDRKCRRNKTINSKTKIRARDRKMTVQRIAGTQIYVIIMLQYDHIDKKNEWESFKEKKNEEFNRKKMPAFL